jgi:hypothetical protein
MSVSQIQILTATHWVNYRPSQQTDTLSPLLCHALWRAVFILNPGTPGAKIDRKMIRRGTGFARFSPNEAGPMGGIWRRMTSTLSKVSGAQLAEFIRFFKWIPSARFMVRIPATN